MSFNLDLILSDMLIGMGVWAIVIFLAAVWVAIPKLVSVLIVVVFVLVIWGATGYAAKSLYKLFRKA